MRWRHIYRSLVTGVPSVPHGRRPDYPLLPQYLLQTIPYESESEKLEDSLDASWDLFDKMDEVETRPKELSRTEKYRLNEETEKARKDGCAPVGRALTVCYHALSQSSELKTSLSDKSVTLFNFHSTKFAERLLKRNIGKLVLVESAISYSKEAKEFARRHQKDFHQVEAYRSDISSLLGIGRKKLAKLPVQLIGKKAEKNPLILKDRHSHDESGSSYSRCPTLITSLPFATQQTSVLDSLQDNLLLYHANMDKESIFSYGAVELITFLSAGVLAHLMCSASPQLSFLSHSHRRQSAIFHKIFQVRVLAGLKRQSFEPRIPLEKAIPHDGKLRELNFMNGLQYGVTIRPQTNILLASKPVLQDEMEDRCLSSSILLPYSYWMQKIGREMAAKKAHVAIGSLCPESKSSAVSIIDESEVIGQISDVRLEEVFLKVKEELVESAGYKKYIDSAKVKRESAP